MKIFKFIFKKCLRLAFLENIGIKIIRNQWKNARMNENSWIKITAGLNILIIIWIIWKTKSLFTILINFSGREWTIINSDSWKGIAK